MKRSRRGNKEPGDWQDDEEKMTSGETRRRDGTSEEMMSEETMSEEMMSEETTSKETMSKETTSKETRRRRNGMSGEMTRRRRGRVER